MHGNFGASLQLHLDQLRFGHEAEPPVNARKTGRLDDVEALAASIDAHGLIHDLVVMREGEKRADSLYYVVDGNRRLAALRRLVETERRPAAQPVGCNEYINGDAAEISLAANIMRLPLHEADQYETFVALAGHGLSEDAIAARFGIERPRVRRFLALGQLHPVIRQAWRDNTFGHQTVSCIRAFTLAPTLDDQERVFLDLQQRKYLYANSIEEAFGAGRGDAGRHVAFVGVAAYVEAGGALVEDLFGTHHVVGDPALAKKLADEKLQAECDRLHQQEGWSWAKTPADLPNGAMWNWEQVRADKASPVEKERLAACQAIIDQAEADEQDEETPAVQAAIARIDEINAAVENRGYDSATRARSGCIVWIGDTGDLEVKPGMLMPQANGKKTSGPDDKPESATISNALAERLSVQLTRAVQAALPQDPRAGIAALLAGALTGHSFGVPVRIRLSGHGMTSANQSDQPFADAFARLCDQDAETLAEIAARVAALAVDMTTFNANSRPLDQPNYAALANGIDKTIMAAAIAEAFDFDNYCASVAKPLLITAIAEAVSPDQARKLAGKPKPDVFAFALENIPGTGWLPPELRLESYVNPLQPPAPEEAKPTPAERKAQGRATAKAARAAEAMEKPSRSRRRKPSIAEVAE